MDVGVLALQGNFALHCSRLRELGVNPLLVRTAAELRAISGLVLPGGESTTLLRLTDQAFRNELTSVLAGGLPALATCAGLILIAKKVTDPGQESLGLLEVTVARNAYGRQIDSFIAPSLTWTSTGRDAVKALADGERIASRTLEGVFIRAPKITSVGDGVEVLIENGVEPVLVRRGQIFGATFHPELSPRAQSVHQLFLAAIEHSRR